MFAQVNLADAEWKKMIIIMQMIGLRPADATC